MGDPLRGDREQEQHSSDVKPAGFMTKMFVNPANDQQNVIAYRNTLQK